MEHRVSVTVDTSQPDAKLDVTEAKAKATEQMVAQTAENSKKIMVLTQQQAVQMASAVWSVAQQSMKLMGITLSSGFTAMINVGVQTLQLFSTMAAMHAATGPPGAAQAILYALQIITATLSIANTIAAQGEAMQEFMRTGNMLAEIHNEAEQIM